MTSTNILCLVYLIAITIAEVITALVSPLGGTIFHFVILIALIISSTVFARSQFQRLFLSLGLAPLIRVLNFSAPLSQFSEIYWFLFVSIPLLAGIFLIIRMFNLQLGETGLTEGTPLVQGVIALSGIGIGLIDYLILGPEPLIPALNLQEAIAPALILLVATGFVEELAFRGVIQSSAIQALGNWGWVYTAVLYSILQIGHLSALHWLFVLLVSLFFGFAVKRHGSILGVSLAHGITNIGLYLIFPFFI
jgi:membrane protease YdiL (CAAX protease family)